MFGEPCLARRNLLRADRRARSGYSTSEATVPSERLGGHVRPGSHPRRSTCAGPESRHRSMTPWGHRPCFVFAVHDAAVGQLPPPSTPSPNRETERRTPHDPPPPAMADISDRPFSRNYRSLSLPRRPNESVLISAIQRTRQPGRRRRRHHRPQRLLARVRQAQAARRPRPRGEPGPARKGAPAGQRRHLGIRIVRAPDLVCRCAR
jgi:hypothetical protein